MGEDEELSRFDPREFWAIKNNEDLHTIQTQKILRERERAILDCIRDNPRTATQIEKITNINRSSVHHYILRMIRNSKPIKKEFSKVGVYYSICSHSS
jgi:DNA-directed RNA polymerase specialized sigma subunit